MFSLERPEGMRFLIRSRLLKKFVIAEFTGLVRLAAISSVVMMG